MMSNFKVILIGIIFVSVGVGSLISLKLSSDEKNLDVLTNVVTIELERAYFEGQKDAIEGDIRIELTDSGNYIWTSSPWDSGEEPIFHPPLINDDYE